MTVNKEDLPYGMGWQRVQPISLWAPLLHPYAWWVKVVLKHLDKADLLHFLLYAESNCKSNFLNGVSYNHCKGVKSRFSRTLAKRELHYSWERKHNVLQNKSTFKNYSIFLLSKTISHPHFNPPFFPTPLFKRKSNTLKRHLIFSALRVFLDGLSFSNSFMFFR